jgi:hypothetical protein
MKNKGQLAFVWTNLKWFSLALSVACLWFVYFMPYAIAYPDHYWVRWIVPFVIFIVLPLSLFITLIFFTKQYKLSIGISAAVILIVGLSHGLLQDGQEKAELSKYGVWGKAIVIDRKHMPEHSGGGWHWGIKCKYQVGEQQYETLYNDDLNGLHPTGDTIAIIYSSRFPKIYALGYEWKK